MRGGGEVSQKTSNRNKTLSPSEPIKDDICPLQILTVEGKQISPLDTLKNYQATHWAKP